jgi:hypothetical protein
MDVIDSTVVLIENADGGELDEGIEGHVLERS